jgi:hypothetical protein
VETGDGLSHPHCPPLHQRAGDDARLGREIVSQRIQWWAHNVFRSISVSQIWTLPVSPEVCLFASHTAHA